MSSPPRDRPCPTPPYPTGMDDQTLLRDLNAKYLGAVQLAERLAQDLEALATKGEPLLPEAMLARITPAS